MSMIGQYARLTPAELQRVIDDCESGLDFVEELAEADEGSESRHHDTDKAWDALDFLLSRRSFPVGIVHGEEEIPGADDWGYGPPRFLTPERVRIAAEVLAATPTDALLDGVTVADLAEAGLYPNIWDQDYALDYVTNIYEALVPFFQAAAHDGHAMLIWLG